jgi:rubredoxin
MIHGKEHGVSNANSEKRPAAADRGPKRNDQRKCPRCGVYGCPAVNGSHVSAVGVKRYRRCAACGWVFTTLQRHGGAEVDS